MQRCKWNLPDKGGPKWLMEKYRPNGQTGESIKKKRSENRESDKVTRFWFSLFKIKSRPETEQAVSKNSEKCLQAKRAGDNVIRQNA